MLRIVNHSTAIAMQVKSNAEFYLRYVLSTDSQYNCHDWIFGSKLSMFRIIIYTCTKESTGRSPLAQQWVILWTSAASGPIGWNWRQCPAPSLWLQLKGPGPSPRASQKKKQQIFCRTFSTHNTYTSYLQQHMQWNSRSGAMRGGAALLRSQMNSH